MEEGRFHHQKISWNLLGIIGIHREFLIVIIISWRTEIKILNITGILKYTSPKIFQKYEVITGRMID
jgi:hypothetical protein